MLNEETRNMATENVAFGNNSGWETGHVIFLFTGVHITQLPQNCNGACRLRVDSGLIKNEHGDLQ